MRGADVNQAADEDPKTLRISMDAKATVKVGPVSRGGTSRVEVKAADHDVEAMARVTPVGIFLPATDDLVVSEVTSKVTSDCLVARLEQWWETVQERFGHITTLVQNLDTGPECHSRRTPFLFGVVQFAHRTGLRVRLAYDPPSHSKSTAIERCWGMLEMHWNGALLECVEAVMAFAQPMRWKGVHPLVELVTTTYKTGVKQSKEAMAVRETQVERLPALEKWFVDIIPPQGTG